MLLLLLMLLLMLLLFDNVAVTVAHSDPVAVDIAVGDVVTAVTVTLVLLI